MTISDFALYEIKKYGYHSEFEVFELLDKLEINYETVRESKKDHGKARIIQNTCGIHYADARHIQLAIASNSDCIVTWNIRDFEKAGDIIQVKTPAEFI